MENFKAALNRFSSRATPISFCLSRKRRLYSFIYRLFEMGKERAGNFRAVQPTSSTIVYGTNINFQNNCIWKGRRG